MSDSLDRVGEIEAEVDRAIDRVTNASNAHVKSAEALIKWSGVSLPVLVVVGALVTEDRLATFFDNSGVGQLCGSIGLALLIATLVFAFGVTRPRVVRELTPGEFHDLLEDDASVPQPVLLAKKILLLEDLRNAAHDRGVVLRGALTSYVLSMASFAATLVLAANHTFG